MSDCEAEVATSGQEAGEQAAAAQESYNPPSHQPAPAQTSSQPAAAQESSHSDSNSHSSSKEDMDVSVALSEVENYKPSYVPVSAVKGKDGQGSLLLKKRTTLSAAQIDKANSGAAGQEAEHNTMLDCVLCKNVMIKP